MRPHLKLERAKSILERRLFLKAMGLGLAAPVALKLAKSATAASAGAPKRCLVMYFPHGTACEHFNPKMAGSGSDPTQFALDMTGEAILGPLEPYKKWVNVYQGFQYPGSYGTHEGIVNILSGVDNGDTTTPRITLEHVIAKGLGVKPLILGACSHQVYSMDLHGMLFWDGSAAVEPQKDPSAVFDKLFGSATASSGTPMQSADDQLRSAMLDLTTAELNQLKTTVSGLTSEQTKLQSHLDAIAALKESGGMGGTAMASCTNQTLASVEAVRKASAGQVLDSSHSNDYFYQEANFRAIFQAQLDLIAKALVCNAAQVIGLMPMYATCEFDFSFIGGSLGSSSGWGHHGGLSHTGYQQSPSAQYNSPISTDNALETTRATFGRAQRWFFQQLATSVIDVLAKTPDPAASDGSMVLDNTLIYVTSEIGDGANHLRASELEYPQLPAYLPMVSIGGAGGGLVSGQVITLPITSASNGGTLSPAPRPATDVYLTLCKAMGVTATFPDTTGTVAGVLA